MWGKIWSFFHKTAPVSESKPQATGCDLKPTTCPDGSVTKRIGPCEYSQCPIGTDQTAGWKTYTNTQYGFEFKYPSDAISIEVINSSLNDVAIHKYDRMIIIGERINVTEPVLVAGKQGYKYSFVTSVNYKYNGFMVPLNNNNYLEVYESSKSPTVLASDFQKIISTFKFTK
jgi:hypothetical protein